VGLIAPLASNSKEVPNSINTPRNSNENLETELTSSHVSFVLDNIPHNDFSILSRTVRYDEVLNRTSFNGRVASLGRTFDAIAEEPPVILVFIWIFFVLSFYTPICEFVVRQYDLSISCTLTMFDQILYSFAIIGMSLFFVETLVLCVILIRNTARRPLTPQSGSLPVDKALKQAVQLSCLAVSLADSQTHAGRLASITQYLQGQVDESLPTWIYNKCTGKRTIDWTTTAGQEQISQFFDYAFGGSDESKTGEIEMSTLDAHGGDVPWHIMLDDAFNNWKAFRSGKMAKKFATFLSVIVSAGMCSASSLTFKMGNVHLFAPVVESKQLMAGDIFEAFYETASGFLKGGWRVYKTGEVSAFFMEDEKINDFDDMYNRIRGWHGYAKTGNLSKYTEIDDNDYDVKLHEAIDLGSEVLKRIPRSQTFERRYISDRLDQLRDYLSEFDQLRTRGGLRIAPFAISLFGRSGSGKSSLTKLSYKAGLMYNELDASDERVAVWADNDAYASNVRSHINAIVFDDFANTKSAFLDFSPAYRLIQVVNNIKYAAPMADVFMKGKVSLNPYFCILSTNVEHLNAAEFSNEPESILRRFYHVLVQPKEEFLGPDGALSKEKIENEFGVTDTPDVWNLTVRTYLAMNKRWVDLSSMRPVEFEGEEMKEVGIHTYLRWLQIQSKVHFKNQKEYIETQGLAPELCPACRTYYCNCKVCPPPPLVSRSLVDAGDDELETLPSRPPKELDAQFGNIAGWFKAKADGIQRFYSEASSALIVNTMEVCDWWSRFDFLPEYLICHPRVLQCCLLLWRNDIKHSLIAGISLYSLLTLFLCYMLPFLWWVWLSSCSAFCYWYVCTTIQVYTRMVRNRILELKTVVKTYTNAWQTRYALISMASIALLLSVMRSHYNTLTEHTGLKPESIKDVEERDAEVNPWIVPVKAPLPMSVASKTTTPDNLANHMRTSLVGCSSLEGKTTLIFFIMSNIAIIPTHFLDYHWKNGKKDIPIRLYKHGNVAKFHPDKISWKKCVSIPGTDFSVANLTTVGALQDFRAWLPLHKYVKQTPARLVTRDICDTTLRSIPTLFEGSSMIKHTFMWFWGGRYNMPQGQETAPGMCMSPLISDAKGSMIIGFHLGGKGLEAGCGIVTLDQVNYAVQELTGVDGVVLGASAGVLKAEMGSLPEKLYNKEVLTSQDIHPKSAVNFIKDGSCMEVYGSTTGRATPHSDVVPTLISASVEKVFGVPQQWGPPKLKGPGVYPYQASLVDATQPSLPIGSMMVTAVGDYKKISRQVKAEIPELFQCSPLSRVETVSGVDGKRFIDAMNFNSSPGFPLSGTKHPLLVDLDPEDYPNITCPRTFVQEVWDEFEQASLTLKAGKRVYAVWKACLKDEATKITKDKVRVFQSAPLVLQLLVRMYFLPIVRIIQMNPLRFECAVGVNAEGPEWQQLWDHMISKGEDRILAGDYSKYDIRMSAEATTAAFDILFDIAEQCDGYTEEDVLFMRMIATEIIYPVMAYNGDLIQLFGTNPSGQNLTVIINSIANSLFMRAFFYEVYPNLDFKNEVAAITYGDDVNASVSENCPKFNHITYAKWLEEHDMKFTMPDKTSDPVEFMHEHDVDFLKRKCRYNPDLECKVGLLDESSIFKRLHSHVLSKELTLQEHSAANIESSLHDWFYYGREVFEERRDQLHAVAVDAGIEHLCPCLNVSYDKRVAHWRHKYLDEELKEEDKITEYEAHCGGGELEAGTFDYLDHCRDTVHRFTYPNFSYETTILTALTMIIDAMFLAKVLSGAWYLRFNFTPTNKLALWWCLFFFFIGGFASFCYRISIAMMYAFSRITLLACVNANLHPEEKSAFPLNSVKRRWFVGRDDRIKTYKVVRPKF
jgi:hypothetical protein